MKILIYVAGMPFDGKTISDGKSLGGSESSGYYLAREMAKRGHDVMMFTNAREHGIFDNVKYMPIGNITEQTPFGDNFEQYAETVPSDVILAQRIPHIFMKKYNSKLNFLWLHDLALRRMQGYINLSLPFLDKIFCVSEFHKEQVCRVFDLKESLVGVLPNAVDKIIYDIEHVIDAEEKRESKQIVYSSRPERGLENLLKPGGIMEKLYSIDPEIQLNVCGYDNTTKEMQGFYQALWQRCEELPNVVNLGPLSKTDLKDLQKNCALHVYPTEFEETSCITVMEQLSCGTPIITTNAGALPETLKESDSVFLNPKSENFIDEFAKEITKVLDDKEIYQKRYQSALGKSEEFNFKNSASILEGEIQNNLSKSNRANKYLNHRKIDKNSELIEIGNDQLNLTKTENLPLFHFLKSLKPGEIVLELACGFSGRMMSVAKQMPHLRFIGVDEGQERVEAAKNFASSNKITNIDFYYTKKIESLKMDFQANAIICSDLLNKKENPCEFVEKIKSFLAEDGYLFFSTPVNNFDSSSDCFDFTEQEILQMFREQEGFSLTFTAGGRDLFKNIFGQYSFFFKTSKKKIGKLDSVEKLNSIPQTLSVCIICKDDGLSLGKTLRSVQQIADEIIVGIDNGSKKSNAWRVAEDFGAKVFRIKSPLETGFAEARNRTLKKATKEWIMWIDDDEVLINQENLLRYLRSNQFDSYAVAQHHFTTEPAGLLKTDTPCRIFRNKKNIKFFGIVHEHPETRVNHGCGKTFLIPQDQVCISHFGYETEEIRQKRFSRNLPLMLRELKEGSKRNLFKFLMMRDWIQFNRFEMDHNGRKVTPEMIKRCQDTIEYWRELVKKKQVRMATDSLPYLTEAVMMVTNGSGIEFEFGLATRLMNIGDNIGKVPTRSERAHFLNIEDLKNYVKLVLDEKTNIYEFEYL